jgi:DNA (cytosine-5)-methyltransferase 1
MSTFPRISTATIGRNKTAPRVWLEGRYLLQAGFLPAHRIEVEFSSNRISIKLAPQGSRVVSSKTKNDRPIPVLDLNSSAIAESFGPVTTLQVYVTEGEIVLTPTQTELLRATRCRNGREGSCFSGGGLLTEAARRAGYDPAFAIEVNDRYAEVFEMNHNGAQMRNMSVEDVPLDSLPPVELLTLGIPCECYSQARRRDLGTGNKRDRSLPPEAHPLSDLTIWSCLLIRALNPATVVIEEAPGYLTSGAGYMMRHFLERAGYTVEAAVLDPRDFGELSGRKRSVIVAHSGTNFSWPTPSPCTRTVKDILDNPNEVEDLYFTAEDKSWLVNHWRTQTAKGNGFAPPQLTEQSTSVPTLKKRYQSYQGDNPVLCHPTEPDTWRLFTIKETMRLHGLPQTYQLDPDSKTISGEILGQGVIVTFFEKIIRGARNLVPARAGTREQKNKTSTSASSTQPSNELSNSELNAQPLLAFA